MSMISTIAGVPHIPSLESLSKTAGALSDKKAGDFGSALDSAIHHVDGYQQQATQAVEEFLKGNGELHNVALATQRAEMAFDLGVQIRNKVVSAYQEVMKMQL